MTTRASLRLPHHRGTTAHISSIYPFSVQPPLAGGGVLMGVDLLAGGAPFRWDPFDAYAAGVVANPNMWVLGELGHGKSTLVKCLLWRMAAVYGLGAGARQFAIADPKGEYVPLAEALGMDVVRLVPGGTTRLNPLADGPGVDDASSEARILPRAGMLVALAATVLGRPLTQLEDALLFAAVERLAATGPSTPGPTLKDVVALVREPSTDMAERLGGDSDAIRSAAEDLAFALDKLLTRSLRGMFDGPSTVRPNWDGPGILLDLSAIPLDAEALPLILVAATAWLQQLIARPGAQRVQVLDEAWALLGNRHTAAYLQACFKLSRAYGVANIAITHRASDLAAQADDGTAVSKLAAGLLHDAGTQVILRQIVNQTAHRAGVLRLTGAEADLVGILDRGRSLWRIGDRSMCVALHATAVERVLCETDGRMFR